MLIGLELYMPQLNMPILSAGSMFRIAGLVLLMRLKYIIVYIIIYTCNIVSF